MSAISNKLSVFVNWLATCDREFSVLPVVELLDRTLARWKPYDLLSFDLATYFVVFLISSMADQQSLCPYLIVTLDLLCTT